MTDLAFSELALVDGFGMVDDVTLGLLDPIPDITLLAKELVVTPTFFLDDAFRNLAGVDFGVLDVCAHEIPLRGDGPNVNLLDESVSLGFASFTTDSSRLRCWGCCGSGRWSRGERRPGGKSCPAVHLPFAARFA